jgi:hypothetical protein
MSSLVQHLGEVGLDSEGIFREAASAAQVCKTHSASNSCDLFEKLRVRAPSRAWCVAADAKPRRSSGRPARVPHRRIETPEPHRGDNAFAAGHNHLREDRERVDEEHPL